MRNREKNHRKATETSFQPQQEYAGTFATTSAATSTATTARTTSAATTARRTKLTRTAKTSRATTTSATTTTKHSTPYWDNLTWLWQQPVRCKQRNIEHNHRHVKFPAFPNIICLASEVHHMGSHQYTDVKAPTHHESITESQQSRATRAFRKWQQTTKRLSIINIIVETVKFQNLAARCIHRC